ncbi:hypothetical protein [Hyphomicrobium sp. CS1GBMeth3]|uniref:hypothetical protein n=1 Tax=Hyphomicrobium sp. CS1GBMeth3 TaxID=1892845 RepID=UPI0009FB0A6F|nr:hypothetical protein [Hyphomicrobium sp. CS1GBMeth3]
MSNTAEREISEEQFLDLAAKVASVVDSLTPVGAGVLAALQLGICNDSRTFSRIFGIAHALVLREVTELAGERGLLAIVGRNARSQRTAFSLTDTSRDLVSRVISMNPAKSEQ